MLVLRGLCASWPWHGLAPRMARATDRAVRARAVMSAEIGRSLSIVRNRVSHARAHHRSASHTSVGKPRIQRAPFLCGIS